MKTASMLRLILGAALVLTALGGTVAQADTLDDIKKAGKVRIAIDLAIPPFGMSDDKTEPAGSDVDLARLLAKDLGVQLEIVTTTGPTRIPMLQSTRCGVTAWRSRAWSSCCRGLCTVAENDPIFGLHLCQVYIVEMTCYYSRSE